MVLLSKPSDPEDSRMLESLGASLSAGGSSNQHAPSIPSGPSAPTGPASSVVPAIGPSPSVTSSAEVSALQQRLVDAKCYSGPIDGQPSAALSGAIAACPSQEPQLRIETGMHVARIMSVGADRACRLVATASEDKTIRLWSLPNGDLLRTLRVPTNAGNGGTLNAVAMSPDARMVAAGGWDAQFDLTGKHSLYVFDVATGALIARAGEFARGIAHLAFSVDGRWLAVTLGGREGIRVFDTATWTSGGE